MDSVICARGESARTFVPVIRALRAGAHGKVIFVDDGNNRGVWRARLAGARIIHGDGNGKAAAMRAGLAHVRSDRVIFADADIAGFRAEHAQRLASPANGMITGLRDNRSFLLGPVPPVSGERSLPRNVAEAALGNVNGYGAELAMNAAIGNLGLPAETFIMRGAVNPRRQPLKRAWQVLRVAPGHLLGLIRFMVSWLTGAISVVR